MLVGNQEQESVCTYARAQQPGQGQQRPECDRSKERKEEKEGSKSLPPRGPVFELATLVRQLTVGWYVDVRSRRMDARLASGPCAGGDHVEVSEDVNFCGCGQLQDGSSSSRVWTDAECGRRCPFKCRAGRGAFCFLH